MDTCKLHAKTAVKNRRILSLIAKPLLKLSGFKVTGSFPSNNRVILVAIPHTSVYDMYLMFLMVYTLGIDMNFLAAKWIFSRIASPFRLYTDPDKQGIPWPLGFIQKYIFIKAGGIPVVRSDKMNQLIIIINILKNIPTINPKNKIALNRRVFFFVNDFLRFNFRIFFSNRKHFFYSFFQPMSTWRAIHAKNSLFYFCYLS